MNTAQQLIVLAEEDREAIKGLSRTAPSALRVQRALLERPIATSGWLAQKTGVTPATVNKSLAHLAHLGVVRELTRKKRNRVFSYVRYIDIMNRGAEPPA